jgi:hypothetical protein
LQFKDQGIQNIGARLASSTRHVQAFSLRRIHSERYVQCIPPLVLDERVFLKGWGTTGTYTPRISNNNNNGR